jgi:nicotinamide-nucleotide adenylyltransferase
MILATIGRWKPLHNGGAVLLDGICAHADHVIIGIGSVNKYDLRNPFTPEETEGMLRAYLKNDKYTIKYIPDFGHIPAFADGKQWAQTVHDSFGTIDKFVCGDLYAMRLMKEYYAVADPAEFLSIDKRVKLNATMVRVEMAKGDSWKELVPSEVAEYIIKNGLDTRFRKEFGLQTLAEALAREYWNSSSEEEERIHTLDGSGVKTW